MATLSVVTPLDAATIVLAAYRGTRLVTSDTIADGPRHAVERWALRVPPGSARREIATLVACNYCAGFWITLVTLLAWRLPALRPAVRLFGAAGAQALLSALDVALNDA